MRAPEGFSLIELLIALSISLFVLVGIVSLNTSMVRFHFEGIRRGEVTGMTLYGLSQLHRKLENASHLQFPNSTSPSGNILSGCVNWSAALSRITGTGKIDAGASVESFYYCVDSANSLMLYRSSVCPPVPPASCGSASAGMDMETVVFRNFFKMDNQPQFFKRSAAVAGVELHYIVGHATPTANVPIPVAYKFNIKIGMNKASHNAED
jgi:prepilin-type N-terminal cleavage/methylation domain-containing protein